MINNSTKALIAYLSSSEGEPFNGSNPNRKHDWRDPNNQFIPPVQIMTPDGEPTSFTVHATVSDVACTKCGATCPVGDFYDGLGDPDFIPDETWFVHHHVCGEPLAFRPPTPKQVAEMVHDRREFVAECLAEGGKSSTGVDLAIALAELVALGAITIADADAVYEGWREYESETMARAEAYGIIAPPSP